MAISLNPEVRARLDAHLDAVERALAAAGSTRERRRGVVDDLEAQILEMLSAKSETPTVGDLEEVLAKLDPPGAYGTGGGGGSGAASTAGAPPVAKAAALAVPRYSRLAIAGFVCILVNLLLMVPVVVLGFFWVGASHRAVMPVEARPVVVSAETEAAPNHAASEPAPRSRVVYSNGGMAPIAPFFCILVLVGPLGLAATVLGWIAFFQIRASKGMLKGKGLALFDGLFYPVLVVLVVGFLLVMSAGVSGY